LTARLDAILSEVRALAARPASNAPS